MERVRFQRVGAETPRMGGEWRRGFGEERRLAEGRRASLPA
ncbi:hypothetical protein PhaeoP10_02448 [Phaeobacter inhibens]|nr:hypothetical protein PhaeoP10_02448 [Phaeobacter inhibens]